MKPVVFGVVGAGWRAEFFLRVAQALPERFRVAGVCARRAEARDAVARRFGVPVHGTPQELLASGAMQFVVTCVPRTANADVVRCLAGAGMPVLSETPPAATREDLIDLWRQTAGGARIQVAEQYPFQPQHAARLAVVKAGRIGSPHFAHVSVAHGYHAMALVRRLLGVGFACPVVTGRTFNQPVVKGPTRAGPPTGEGVAATTQALVFYDFGDRLALYDFSFDQYFSLCWGTHLHVRGERGELVDDRVTALADARTPVVLTLERHAAGTGGNLEGHHLKGIQCGEQWVYRNPLAPARLSDDEVAVGTCLLRMADYVRTGEPFYPLAEACQDAYLELLANETLTTGQPARAQPQPWACPPTTDRPLAAAPRS